MKFPRREFLHLAAGAVVLPAAARVAAALDYPTRPVHLLVGYAAGAKRTSTRSIRYWRLSGDLVKRGNGKTCTACCRTVARRWHGKMIARWASFRPTGDQVKRKNV